MTESNGTTATGFERVRAAFESNFDKGLEVGASFSAYYRGEKVVDLWGGTADAATGRAWDEHTMALVFSTTKGVVAMCANKLAQEGALDVDAPVAQYWPEFAAGGKADIPVSFLLSHQAGLAWIDGEMTLDQALSWDPVVDALALQVPHYEPGSQHGYHATTFGWLVGEVVRRITAKSVGTYFREAIATPLGVDFWIGLPESEEPRVASLEGGLADPSLESDPRCARSSTRSWVRTPRSVKRCSPPEARSRTPTSGIRVPCTRQKFRPRAVSATRDRSPGCTPRVSAPSTDFASSPTTSSGARPRN
jgi:CubicO group peptidase (beta-lactamase class C family)